jgi:hypothetical protein
MFNSVVLEVIGQENPTHGMAILFFEKNVRADSKIVLSYIKKRKRVIPDKHVILA